MIQTVEAVNSMSLSKGKPHLVGCRGQLCEATRARHPCANFYYNTPVLFYHRLYISKANPSKVAEILTPFGTF